MPNGHSNPKRRLFRQHRPICDIAKLNSDDQNFDGIKYAITALAVARACGKPSAKMATLGS
jgi:hypothetical protein